MESTKCGRRARDRRALTGEAGNASRRQVMMVASAWRTPDESGLNISHVMRTNFGDTRACKPFCVNAELGESALEFDSESIHSSSPVM